MGPKNATEIRYGYMYGMVTMVWYGYYSMGVWVWMGVGMDGYDRYGCTCTYGWGMGQVVVGTVGY
jgi:hypothetical protein